MDTSFWYKAHGGVTHFPIALLIASAVFDLAAHAVKKEEYQGDLRAAAFWSLMLAALGACGAVLTGLFLSAGQTGGSGLLWKHHLFVWPSFGLIIALAVWRIMIPKEATRGGQAIYLFAVVVGAVLVALAGYWGGEMVAGGS